MLSGTIFTDGSAVLTSYPDVQRAGWSLVKTDRFGNCVAACWGPVPLAMAPRQEARDGEDYAFHMAGLLCTGRCSFFTDCRARLIAWSEVRHGA